MTTRHSSPISRQLQAYEEGWKAHHDEAMRFWDFQEQLAIGIAIFKAITSRNESWRERVSQGLDSFSEEENTDVLGLFKRWFKVADRNLSRLEVYEEQFGQIDVSADFRECYDTAEKTIANWVPPVLSMAQALHADELSQEEAVRLHRILESGQGRLQHQPKPIG
jgi:hypothetical protein